MTPLPPKAIAGLLSACAAFLLHRVPLKTHLGGVCNILRLVLGLDRLQELRIARLRNAVTVNVRLSDYNGRMLYFFGTPDPKIVATCRALLRPTDVFLDIGANHGAVAFLCHDRPAESHLVEPQPQLVESIRRTIRDHALTSLRVHPIGLAAEDGELPLSVNRRHTGAASMAKHAGACPVIPVPVLKTAHFLTEVVGDRPCGAKLDVEGIEACVLPGLLEHPSVRFVLFECNTPSTRDVVWRRARQRDLALFGLSPALLSVRLAPIRERSELRRYHDVLAIRITDEGRPRRVTTPGRLAALQRHSPSPSTRRAGSEEGADCAKGTSHPPRLVRRL